MSTPDIAAAHPKAIHGLPFDEYLALDAMSAHGLMLVERSPLHFQHAKREPRAPSTAQALGTLTHMAVLEWDRYQSLVRVAPDVDRRTKLGKETAAAFEAECAEIGAIVATVDQDQKACAMREAVMGQPFARALFESGSAEVTLSWIDTETSVACKARPDWVCDEVAALVDLKTAADASEPAFAKASGSFKYHMQAAWYQDAAESCGLGERAFIFVAVEPDPPHGVGLYELDPEAIRVGRIRNRRALETYAECLASGEFSAYPREIQTLVLPKWAL